jgi:hypothetical protein
VQTGSNWFAVTEKKLVRTGAYSPNDIIPQEPTTPVKMKPTTPDGSPRTLAIKRTEVELEYMEEAARMNQAIQEKEEELRSAQCVGSNEDSQGLLRIEGELKVLKVS